MGQLANSDSIANRNLNALTNGQVYLKNRFLFPSLLDRVIIKNNFKVAWMFLKTRKKENVVNIRIVFDIMYNYYLRTWKLHTSQCCWKIYICRRHGIYSLIKPFARIHGRAELCSASWEMRILSRERVSDRNIITGGFHSEDVSLALS